MIVVDASVLVEFLLGRRQVLEAVTRELSGALDEVLHAPELIEPEALNALRRLLRNGMSMPRKRIGRFQNSRTCG